MYNFLWTHLKHQKSIPYFFKRFFISTKIVFFFLIANFVSWIIFKPLIQWIPNLIIKRNFFFSISRICIMFQCFACNGILDSFTLNFFYKRKFLWNNLFFTTFMLYVFFLISMINSLCYLVIVCIFVISVKQKWALSTDFMILFLYGFFLFLKFNCTFEKRNLSTLLRHEENFWPSKLIG